MVKLPSVASEDSWRVGTVLGNWKCTSGILVWKMLPTGASRYMVYLRIS